MKKIARHRREETRSQLILLSIVVGIGMFLGFFGWRLWLNGDRFDRITPQPISLADRSDRQRVEMPCYEFYLPQDFELLKSPDCQLNAYARPRKHAYFQVTPYYNLATEDDMFGRWRERWLTLGAVERSRDRVIIGGRTAWKLVDYYQQNGESFVSYLVFLEDSINVDGRDSIRAFELRAWATSSADQALVDEVLQDWRWRF